MGRGREGRREVEPGRMREEKMVWEAGREDRCRRKGTGGEWAEKGVGREEGREQEGS